MDADDPLPDRPAPDNPQGKRTAELAGLDAEVDPLLIEWDYGGV